jgi:hypothetical protein
MELSFVIQCFIFKDVAFSRKSALLLKLRTLIAMYAKFIPIFAVESFVLFSITRCKNDNSSYRKSLFAENGVIVRNLNYRPWQWVYSISSCKSFPGGF